MIALMVPTRGRPENVAELQNAINDTAFSQPEMMLGVDDDDDVMLRCSAFAHYRTIYTQPRMTVARWCDYLSARALSWPGVDVIGFMGDDHRPRTRHWDVHIRMEMAKMGSGMVYCADGLQNERLPTSVFFSADVIRALGYFCPPQLQHMYLDNFWLALARGIGRVTYLPDVLIEHMHPDIGKAEYDDSYRESSAKMGPDSIAYLGISEPHGELDKAIARVRDALGFEADR
jgi:hypothetical protein